MKRFAAQPSLRGRWGAILLLAIGVAAWTPALRADDDDSSLGGGILSLFGFGSTKAKNVSETSDPSSTHQFKKAVKIRSSDGVYGVQTFCLDKEGRIVALVTRGIRWHFPFHVRASKGTRSAITISSRSSWPSGSMLP
jgi:hypothetical protein